MTASDGREFPLRTVLTLTTGRMWAEDFGKFHEFCEHLCGHPVWTHEFADKAFVERMKAAAFELYPRLAEVDTSECSVEEFEARYPALCAEYGESMAFECGYGTRIESPVESLHRIAPGKQAIVVSTKEPNDA